jgi:nucleoside-diphosphate-sugar epimerase
MPMDIAVTGGNGRLGRQVVERLLRAGHRVRSLDRAAPQVDPAAGLPAPAPILEEAGDALRTLDADINRLDALTEAISGCDALIHLAAFPGPQGPPPGVVYANNTLTTYNALYAASALGIRKVCLASSINALGGIASRRGRFDYFPVDEQHPTYNEDDYSLSKWVGEIQADSFARRFPEMTISSLRFHALVDHPLKNHSHTKEKAEDGTARGLWGWTLITEGARACELALEPEWRGHEVFFIVAPETHSSIPTLELAEYAYPEVPIHGDLSGHKSFYDSSKAGRLLGWYHQME